MKYKIISSLTIKKKYVTGRGMLIAVKYNGKTHIATYRQKNIKHIEMEAVDYSPFEKSYANGGVILYYNKKKLGQTIRIPETNNLVVFHPKKGITHLIIGPPQINKDLLIMLKRPDRQLLK